MAKINRITNALTTDAEIAVEDHLVEMEVHARQALGLLSKDHPSYGALLRIKNALPGIVVVRHDRLGK